jgi:hypothetical protein
MAFLNYVRNQWDRVAAWTCIGLGALALLIGWIGVSGHVYPAEQNSYIASGGLVGLFLLGLGGLMWISADLRDEWRKLDAIERALDGRSTEPVADAAEAQPAPRRGRRAAAGRA